MPLKNAKHEAVVVAFVADRERIGWRAYQKVYPNSSQRAAETGFSRLLLKNAEFEARIAELQAEIAAAVRDAQVMDLHEVLSELSNLGRGNLQDCGHLLISGQPVQDLEALTRAEAAAIAELTVETFMDGAGEAAREVKRVKLKMHDKRGALAELRRHLEPEKHEHSGPNGGPIESKNAEPMSDLDAARRMAFLLFQAAAPTPKG